MVVNIRIAHPTKGDESLQLVVPEAVQKINEYLGKDYIVSVNGNAVQEKTKIADGDDVMVYPPIGGG